ncbi:MAG TPA: hypothetical protein DDX84_01195, partial [Nitrospiraceae bacterium]|nr:hypothetical protein [Nitrospiraceae bacterium]
DGDTLTFSASGLPSGAAFNTSMRTFNWTPGYSQSGSYSVTFTVSDGSLTDSEVITITVNNTNRAPSADAGLDQTVYENGNVSLIGSGSDPDGDTVTYNWIQTTGILVTLIGANTNNATFTAPVVSIDTTFTFQLTVSDGSLSNNDSVNVLVRNAVDADSDGYDSTVDCDDNNAAINPGAVEILDGIDNNCNNIIDEGFDNDGDGYSILSGDCDDNDPAIYTGAPELVDDKDNDCNGVADDNTVVGTGVQVTPASGITLTFDEVIATGTTTVTAINSGPAIPLGYKLPSTQTYYNIETTANYNSSRITVCINYNEGTFTGVRISERTIRMFHWNGISWENVTIASYPDITANRICGRTWSLSPFILVGESTTSAGVAMDSDSYNMNGLNYTSGQINHEDVAATTSSLSSQLTSTTLDPPAVSTQTPERIVSRTETIDQEDLQPGSILNLPVVIESAPSIPVKYEDNQPAVAIINPPVYKDLYSVNIYPQLTNIDEDISFDKVLSGTVSGAEGSKDISFRISDESGNEYRVTRVHEADRIYATNKGLDQNRLYMTATPGEGIISLEWLYSGKVKGFYVLRSNTKEGPYIRVQESRLHALDAEGIYKYVFTDHQINGGDTYYYRIEVLDQEGKIILTDPVLVFNSLQ